MVVCFTFLLLKYEWTHSSVPDLLFAASSSSWNVSFSDSINYLRNFGAITADWRTILGSCRVWFLALNLWGISLKKLFVQCNFETSHFLIKLSSFISNRVLLLLIIWDFFLYPSAMAFVASARQDQRGCFKFYGTYISWPPQTTF
jgi:hypothetical protein